ncbi:MAG: hypothetical protein O2931_03165 [Planctomycetota bacterium]|nr:hypothetical protein [Planctomycetota bacterium]
MSKQQLAIQASVFGLAFFLGHVAHGQTATDRFSDSTALQATIEAELINSSPAPSGIGPIEEIEAEELPLGQPLPDDEQPSDGSEIVRERYENGQIKIERHVVQDDQENYVNHGEWRMWDPDAKLVAMGNYLQNMKEGEWSRWYRADEANLFKTDIFDQFESPFLSTAQFQSDLLDGKWVITDNKKLKIVEWNFAGGKRHGKSTWWYPSGQCMKELNYDDGILNGELIEWLPDGTLVTRDRYELGRRITKRTGKFPSGQKKSEGIYLKAKLEVKDLDDWWNATVLTYSVQGKDEKHGAWTSWYETGQKKVVGNYQDDQPDGEFIWWHANGQKALRSEYQQGKEDGNLAWWHENGQKSISGAYGLGAATGRWVWWDENGKVSQRVDFNADGEGQVLANDSQNENEQSTPFPTPIDRSAQRSILNK